MLDGIARRIVQPGLDRAAALLARRMTADQVTLAGAGFGLLAGGLIAAAWPGLALLALLASRIADGLDGAVARIRGKSDFGGVLDIACDFVFYAAIPLGFVLADPAGNGVAGAALLAAFYINAATFLGYAILAEKRGMQTQARGEKSLYFTAGLMEGTETIGFFVLMCLWPAGFVPLAWVFAGLCLVTAFARLRLAAKVFG
ncbi:MAG: phosphatidylglycerophosphate synthase [Rhodobacteraceae bacterium PARR1]|nr:MAG: phosphatidylglycerophosphate synthase [Rhodobacteraceae bacterium PARR1]